MLQITPQMRILVAVEAVDFRNGIDSLAELCRAKLDADPFSGCLFVFPSRRATFIKVLVLGRTEVLAGDQAPFQGTLSLVATRQGTGAGAAGASSASAAGGRQPGHRRSNCRETNAPDSPCERQAPGSQALSHVDAQAREQYEFK
jgi:transposase